MELVLGGRGELPTIVTGDFNASERRAAAEARTNDAGFVDAFRAANPEAPGHTVWQRVDAPESTVRRRVDYVFLVPGRRIGGRVLEKRVVLNEPGRAPDGAPLWPSDYYGVYAEIDLGPRAAAACGPTGGDPPR